MKIKSLDHITINTKDIDKSIEFYKNILCLKKLNSVDLGDHILHYFQLYDDCRLELIEYLQEQNSLTTGNTDLGIYRHFAIVVDELDEIMQKCNLNRYTINLQPTYIEALKCTVMLIQDPNGVEIELIEKDRKTV